MKRIMGYSMSNLGETLHGYIPKLNTYWQLALKQEPSDEDEDRLDEIYTAAQSDSLLNFFITWLDQVLGEKLGLLNDDTIKKHGDQQAWLREHLEEALFDRDSREEMQKLLKEQGLYDGPLDGILGERSREAVDQLRKSSQALLQKEGYYRGAIDGELGNQSVTAVRKFQRSHCLEDDGVLGPKTIHTLLSS